MRSSYRASYEAMSYASSADPTQQASDRSRSLLSHTYNTHRSTCILQHAIFSEWEAIPNSAQPSEPGNKLPSGRPDGPDDGGQGGRRGQVPPPTSAHHQTSAGTRTGAQRLLSPGVTIILFADVRPQPPWVVEARAGSFALHSAILTHVLHARRLT